MTTDEKILEHLRKAEHHLRVIECLVRGDEPPVTQDSLEDTGGDGDPPPPPGG